MYLPLINRSRKIYGQNIPFVANGKDNHTQNILDRRIQDAKLIKYTSTYYEQVYQGSK